MQKSRLATYPKSSGSGDSGKNVEECRVRASSNVLSLCCLEHVMNVGQKCSIESHAKVVDSDRNGRVVAESAPF